MFHVDRSPAHYRQREAEARDAAAKAHSHNMRQIQLELADVYRSLAEQAQAQGAHTRRETECPRLNEVGGCTGGAAKRRWEQASAEMPTPGQ